MTKTIGHEFFKVCARVNNGNRSGLNVLIDVRLIITFSAMPSANYEGPLHIKLFVDSFF